MSGGGTGPVLTAEGVTVVRGSGRRAHTVIRQLDLGLDAGEIVGVSGPSGVGKSSLIGVLGGELLPAAGTVHVRTGDVDGTPRAVRRMRPGTIALIAQDPVATLDGLWSIGRSVAEPLRVAGVPRREVTSRVRDALDSVRLAGLEPERLPHEISVGQAQRVCIARALVARPALILADEPTSALDVLSAASIAELLQEVAAQGTVVVLVSHNHRLLDSISHRRLALADGRLSPL